jgi:hypothetical protein
MSNEQTDAQRAAQAAIDEAARTVAQSARRAAEQAQQATRTLLDHSAELNRSLLGTWSSTTEALWRATFELQNAQLGAGLSWWQTLVESQQSTVQLLQQWDGVAQQTQQAWLESFQASMRTLGSAAERGAGSAR